MFIPFYYILWRTILVYIVVVSSPGFCLIVDDIRWLF